MTVGWLVVIAVSQPLRDWLTEGIPLVPLAVGLWSSLTHLLRFLWRDPAPARFLVREGVGFVVPSSRRLDIMVVSQVVLSGFAASVAISWWIEPDQTGSGTIVDQLLRMLMPVLAAMFGGLTFAVAVGAARGRPRLELTPYAVVQKHLTGRRTIPWEALGPVLPPRIQSWRTLTLTLHRPELVISTGWKWQIGQLDLSNVGMRPEFLALVLQYYLDHPDRRQAIGTHAEHEQLLAALEGSSAPPAVRGPSTR